MKKDLRNELNEMKFLFGYKPGKVISEQHMPKMEEDFDIEDLMMSEPGVAEPEVKPDTDTDREERRTFDPSRRERDPGRLPYEDPDTHPQGRGGSHELDMPEVEYELEIDDEPDFNNFSDETNEPFIEDVDSDYENSDLADLVNKYLNKLK
jgi:hypothetical protein